MSRSNIKPIISYTMSSKPFFSYTTDAPSTTSRKKTSEQNYPPGK